MVTRLTIGYLLGANLPVQRKDLFFPTHPTRTSANLTAHITPLDHPSHYPQNQLKFRIKKMFMVFSTHLTNISNGLWRTLYLHLEQNSERQ